MSFKVAIAGLGTVGCAVIDTLQKNADLLNQPIEIVGIHARTKNKQRSVDLAAYHWYDTLDDLLAVNADCVVELMGGEDIDGPAGTLVRAALGNGTPVVTANKALLAHHYDAIMDQARASIRFDAAICGGIPVVPVLTQSLAGNRITRIEGILNGTCNYILSVMETQGRDFDDVLNEAQSEGYAEADPTLDIGGFDAQHKLALLARLAFGQSVALDDVAVRGITDITLEKLNEVKSRGGVVRLVGSAEMAGDQLIASVKPVSLAKHHPLAHIDGVTNALMITATPVGELVLSGPGAGGGATASAVVGDIVSLINAK